MNANVPLMNSGLGACIPLFQSTFILQKKKFNVRSPQDFDSQRPQAPNSIIQFDQRTHSTDPSKIAVSFNDYLNSEPTQEILNPKSLAKKMIYITKIEETKNKRPNELIQEKQIKW